ncbi:hypothetical protein [Curtobacterium sp. RRHDQ10]|uniref:hypothetical protein n=1 Tax=Curtobacterium phyllosphaerae TaxID=3413379 RepID=UPI003BF11951
MIDPNNDRPRANHTHPSRTTTPELHPLDRIPTETDTEDSGTPRGRRRTRKNILWASIAVVVLGAVFLVVSSMVHAPLAPPIVIMVAGVLGAALSGALRHASASDRAHGTVD